MNHKWNDYRLDASSGNTDSLIVLLHGVGANGQDLLDLGHALQPHLPNTAFISPDAPFAFDMAPDGRQWFSLGDTSLAQMTAGADAANALLKPYLESLCRDFSVPLARLALLGFSQGTMMALYTGLRLPTIAGIVGYSGLLLSLPEGQALPTTPITLIHGEEDPVVPASSSHHAAHTLQNVGIDVHLHTIPQLPHSIDQQGFAIGAQFLIEKLS